MSVDSGRDSHTPRDVLGSSSPSVVRIFRWQKSHLGSRAERGGPNAAVDRPIARGIGAGDL
jgi:hypothetical protein